MSVITDMYDRGCPMVMIIRQKKSMLVGDKSVGMVQDKPTIKIARELVYREIYPHVMAKQKEQA